MSSPQRRGEPRDQYMSNMAYCRFQNSVLALKDCEGIFEEMLDGNPEPLSDEELAAAQQLAAGCLNIVQMLAERGAVYFAPDMDLAPVIVELNDAAR